MQTVLLFTLTFLYYYEADVIQELLKKNEKKLSRSFNFMFRYIDDVLSLNNKQHHLTVIRLRDDSQISKPIDSPWETPSHYV
jgi:hypothetical protein